ncbi:MAG: RadC family protein [Firmicutes bacterium]|nr:RadC family protein [Bacillota bacterium]
MHDGHRQRMRDRIAEHGVESLNDHEFLEYLLYFAQPRVNTNEQAHRLMAEFGSLRNVLESDADRLAKVKGIGPAAAQFLSLIPDICRRYYMDCYKENSHFLGRDDILKYLQAFFLGEKDEMAVMIMLDARMHFLDFCMIAKGNSREVALQKQNILINAVQARTTYVVFSHNHPSDHPFPSSEDLVLTEQLVTMFNVVNITLLDHLIICPNGSYYSFAKEHLV